MRPAIPDFPLGPRDRPLLVMVTAAGVVAMPLRARWVVLGSASDCDVVIDDRTVSPHHARLVPGGPGALEDLGSECGTRLFGIRLAPHQRVGLPFGAVFRLGDVRCVLERRRHRPTSG